MSYPVECPGCLWGNHERHDSGWGTRRGLIGGLSCDCPGDCAERAKERAEQFAREFAAAPIKGIR